MADRTEVGVEDAGRDAAAVGEHPRGHERQRGMGPDAYRFTAVGKKDMAYAALFALVRALIWLKVGELEFQTGGEEYTGIYVM